MNSLESVYLIFSIVLIFIGHYLRNVRWIYQIGSLPEKHLRDGYFALSLGYICNAVLPARLGELIRVYVFSIQSGTRIANVLAMVIVERIYDLIVVSLLFLVIGVARLEQIFWGEGLSLAIFAVAVFVFLSCRDTRFVRRSVWELASIFNSKIRLQILDLVYSVFDVQNGIRLKRGKFFTATFLMWTIYLASYLCFSRAIGVEPFETVKIFHGNFFLPFYWSFGDFKLLPTGLSLILLTFVPCLSVVLYNWTKSKFRWSSLAKRKWMGIGFQFVSPKSSDRFGDFREYLNYLDRYFSCDESAISKFDRFAMDDAVVIEILKGGSAAVVGRVMQDSKVCIRKFAIGEGRSKLETQFKWLKDQEGSLPVPAIFNTKATKDFFYYDMPYSLASKGFSDVIHSQNIESSWALMSKIIERITQFHSKNTRDSATDEDVEKYILEKVCNNFDLIRKYLRLADTGNFTVNGIAIDLRLLEKYTSSEFYVSRFINRETAIIHGDLTIENIIVNNEFPDGYYVIDPNSENTFNSPLIDYAKIFQSLHLGYEFLGLNTPFSFDGERLSFLIPRSEQYAELFSRTSSWIRESYGIDFYRQVLLHEIINYFRLVPYKFKRSFESGLVYFGCLLILIHSYENEFENA